MVFVATGRLLGAKDIADKQVQSVYGIVDPVVGKTAYTDLRAALAPLQMTEDRSTGTRTVRCASAVSSPSLCSSAAGWVVDLPTSGERVNVEMKLRSGTLIAGSNVPTGSACSSSGYGRLNYFDFKSGLAVSDSGSQQGQRLRSGAQLADRRPDRHQAAERRREGDHDHVGRLDTARRARASRARAVRPSG